LAQLSLNPNICRGNQIGIILCQESFWKPRSEFGSGDISIDRYVIGWRLSKVSNFDDKKVFVNQPVRCQVSGRVVLFFEVLAFEGEAIHAYVSPQLAALSSFGPLYEGASSPPQKAGGRAKNDSPNGNDALGADPFQASTPSKRAPFFPVFGLGAVTFLISMFAGYYVDDWGRRLGDKPKWKWGGRLLRACAVLIAVLGSFSFAFGFPWAALL
jgi:hypothetical protein